MTSAMGQPEKSSRRAYIFRTAPDSCRKANLAALMLSANCGIPHCKNEVNG